MAEEEADAQHNQEQEDKEAELQEHEQEEEALQAEDDESRSVDSTMISEWGYNREAEEIEVVFNNGNSQSYGCTLEQWEAAKNATSPGKFMHESFL